MSRNEKNSRNRYKTEAVEALLELREVNNERYETRSILDVAPGMDILDNGKPVRVKTIRADACSKHGVHVNTTKCYDIIARVVVVK